MPALDAGLMVLPFVPVRGPLPRRSRADLRDGLGERDQHRRVVAKSFESGLHAGL